MNYLSARQPPATYRLLRPTLRIEETKSFSKSGMRLVGHDQIQIICNTISLSLLSSSFSTLSPSSHTLPYYFTRARSKARALSDGASERMPPRARGMRRLSLSLLGLWVATHNLVML